MMFEESEEKEVKKDRRECFGSKEFGSRCGICRACEDFKDCEEINLKNAITAYDPILQRNALFEVKRGYAYSTETGFHFKLTDKVLESLPKVRQI